MKKSIIFLLVYLILLVNHGKAQPFTNYTTASTSTTLCNNTVNAIAIDTQGNKWFGTSEGVSKFDGTHWTTYTTEDGLSNNNILDIDIDKQDNIYVTTDSGVNKFDGANWTTFNPEGILTPPIAIDSYGNIWWALKNEYDYRTEALVKFDGIHLTNYPTPYPGGNPIIAIDTQDNIFLALVVGGLVKEDVVFIHF